MVQKKVFMKKTIFGYQLQQINAVWQVSQILTMSLGWSVGNTKYWLLKSARETFGAEAICFNPTANSSALWPGICS